MATNASEEALVLLAFRYAIYVVRLYRGGETFSSYYAEARL